MLRTLLPILMALVALPSIAAAQQVYDVYIIAGQSNADGRGLESDIFGNPLLANPSNAIISYLNPSDPSENDGAGDGDVSSGGFQNLAAGFSVAPGEVRVGGVPSGTNYFGLEISFAASIGAATGSDNQVAIVKVTRGGTNLRNDWDASATDGDPVGFLYTALIDQVNSSLDELRDGGANTANVEGFLWHQGESDSGNAGVIEAYPERFTDLVEGVRGNFGSDIPVVLGELAPNRPGNTESFNSTLQTFVNTTTLSGISLVSSEGLTTPGDTIDGIDDDDFTHFDAASQLVLGERYATALAATPVTVDSAEFNFEGEGTTIGGTGIGGSETVTSSGGESITFTVTDITSHADNTVGSELVSLSDDPDAGHTVNINNGESLGVNGASGGHEADGPNFSPGESLSFVFDEDIEFISIDLQSFDAAGENNGFRLSSSAFDDVEITVDDLLEGDDANEFFFDGGLIVAAGTEITFEAFSTTGQFNARDSFRIQSFVVNIVTVPEPSSLAILGLLGGVVSVRRRR